MKQILPMNLRRDRIYFLFFACLLVALLSAFAAPAVAQKIQEQVLITRIDASTFPAVKVYAILRDRRGKPIPTGNLGDLTIVEKVFDHEEVVSDEQHQFTVNSISTEAEVLFVIDAAGDLTKPGASREAYLVEMQTGTPNRPI